MYPDGRELPNGSDVELLDTRPPRPGRRWAQVLIGLAAAAGVGALLVARAGSDPPPSSSPLHPSGPAVVSNAVAPSPSSGPAVVVSAELAFARVGPTVYALDAGQLVTIDLNTGARDEYSSAGVVPADRYALLADVPAHRLWLVAATEERTVVEFLDPSTLAVTGQHESRGQYLDAATLGGRLYLATTSGVSVVSQVPETQAPRPPAISGDPLAIGADPTRHRLLVVSFAGRSMRIVALRPGRGRPDLSAPPPIGKGDVVTAGGRIWAAGFGQHGVLARLDPASLRVIRHSPVELEVGVGAVIVDAGRRHLLVRSGGGNGDGSGGSASDLWCVDAGTGAITRHWSPAAGTAVLTEQGVVLLPPGRPLQRLPSGACRG